MSKKANPAVIGSFVIGAIILFTTGILLFGSSRFLSEHNQYVLFFEESLKGLNIGAPVKFSDIKLRFNAEDMSVATPIFIETSPVHFQTTGGKDLETKDEKKRMQLLIDRGMRAQLQLESMVTGQLFIEVDFHPSTPCIIVGTEKNLVEIPTMPSGLVTLTKKIQELPLEELVNTTLSAVKGIDRLANEFNISELNKSITMLKQTIDDFGELIKNIDSQVKPIAAGFKDTAKAANATLEQITTTLEEVEHFAGRDSPLFYEITKTLQDISAASRSIRAMTDYLERHPESLIRGKKGTGER